MQPGILVVLDEPLDMVVERMQAGGGKDTDLAHGAAEHAPVANGPPDDVARPGEQRAAGRAQSF